MLMYYMHDNDCDDYDENDLFDISESRASFTSGVFDIVWNEHMNIDENSKPSYSNYFLMHPYISDAGLLVIDGEFTGLPLTSIGLLSHEVLLKESDFYKEYYDKILCDFETGMYVEFAEMLKYSKVNFYIEDDEKYEMHLGNIEKQIPSISSIYIKWIDELTEKLIQESIALKDRIDMYFDELYPDFLEKHEQYYSQKNIDDFKQFALKKFKKNSEE